jgi:hypothetical protein
MRVRCEVRDVSIETDYGREIAGVRATCLRCGNETESFGTSGRSVSRCLALMRKQCPGGEDNLYVERRPMRSDPGSPVLRPFGRGTRGEKEPSGTPS